MCSKEQYGRERAVEPRLVRMRAGRTGPAGRAGRTGRSVVRRRHPASVTVTWIPSGS